MSKGNALSEAANLLASLTIGDGAKRNQIDTNAMEWKYGGANLMNKFATSNSIDSDDDSEGTLDLDDFIKNDPDFEKNPLKILASRSEVPKYPFKKPSFMVDAAEDKIIKDGLCKLRDESEGSESYLDSLSKRADQSTKISQSNLGKTRQSNLNQSYGHSFQVRGHF